MALHSKKIIKKTSVGALLLGEIIIGVMCSVVSFVIFSRLLMEVMRDATVQADIRISQAIYALRNPDLTAYMSLVTKFGHELLLVTAVLLGIVLYIRRKYHDIVLLIVGIVGGYVINTIIKMIIQRPRPELSPLYQEFLSSFPSGHAMNAFIFYSLIAFFVYRHTKRWIFSAVVAAFSGTMIALVGFSRVYLGVHYPSDIIAGFVAGFWWVVTVLVILKTLHYLRTR